jgi:hypothetical protein
VLRSSGRCYHRGFPEHNCFWRVVISTDVFDCQSMSPENPSILITTKFHVARGEFGVLLRKAVTIIYDCWAFGSSLPDDVATLSFVEKFTIQLV